MENKIKLLFSHVVALEERFGSPPGDVAELRRRDRLIQYVVTPLPSFTMLNPFQRVQGHRGTIVREAGVTPA